ncbi:MAG: hypothetical protein AAGA42_00965 [Actinomycetota bacterium]
MSAAQSPHIARPSTAVAALVAAVLAISAVVLFGGAWRDAGAAPGDDDATYVPTPGCRAFDYRPGDDQVGPRSTPIGPRETHTQQITGGVGECVGALAIPADAVGVAMNVTAVGATAQSNVRLFPADRTDVPLLSSLNVASGQTPVPNKVDVRLSPDGAIKVFNQNGAVFLVGDLVGYYTNSSLRELAQSRSFTVTAEFDGSAEPSALPAAPVELLEVTIDAPVDGVVTVSSQAVVGLDGIPGNRALCRLERSTTPVPERYDAAELFVQVLGLPAGNFGTLTGVRAFDVLGGQSVTVELRCMSTEGGSSALSRNVVAVFTAS